MIRTVIRRAARAYVRAAVEWYESQEVGLGRDFVRELDLAVERIGSLPLQFSDVGQGFRRVLLHRFPHSAYFRLKKSELAIIFAVLHQHRSPSEWKRRADIEGGG